MCFFAFQAILNTFYFWVKNLEKKYSKCQEGTPPPHNWKNILCLFFMFHAMFLEKKYLIAKSYSFSLVEAGASSFMKPNALGHWAS